MGTLGPERQEGKCLGPREGPRQRYEGRKNHVLLRDDGSNQVKINGRGVSDKNLSPQHKGPCTSECGAERPLKLEGQGTVLFKLLLN